MSESKEVGESPSFRRLVEEELLLEERLRRRTQNKSLNTRERLLEALEMQEEAARELEVDED